MAVEQARGCGYRKVGGIYLVTLGEGHPCGRMPIHIKECECCGHVPVKKSRGWQWILWSWMDKVAKQCQFESLIPVGRPWGNAIECEGRCPMRPPVPDGKLGLLWIGEKHYKNPQLWLEEAAKMGVSRKISAIPKDFKIGETWVAAAHKYGASELKFYEEGAVDMQSPFIQYVPGIVQLFLPTAIELIVTPSMKEEDWVQKMVEKQGVTLVEVPEDDPDHMPTVQKKTKRQESVDRYREIEVEEDGEDTPLLG